MRSCLLPSERLQNRAIAGAEGRLVDVELVWIDGALHDILAEPIDAGDEHHVAETRLGVEREHDAARGAVGAHHLHHADREADLEVIEAVVDPIGDRAVGEDRGEAAAAGLEQCIGAAHVEEAFVLAGEARRGQILRRRGAAHGDGDVRAVVGLQFPIGADGLLPQFVDSRWRGRRAARFGGSLGEQVDAPLVELVEEPVQRLPGLCGGECVAVGFGSKRKAIRHQHAFAGQRRSTSVPRKRSCRRPARRRRAGCRKTSGYSCLSARALLARNIKCKRQSRSLIWIKGAPWRRVTCASTPCASSFRAFSKVAIERI